SPTPKKARCWLRMSFWREGLNVAALPFLLKRGRPLTPRRLRWDGCALSLGNMAAEADRPSLQARGETPLGFRRVHTNYDEYCERACGELREPNIDGGETIVTAIFSYRTTADLSSAQVAAEIERKARHAFAGAARK